MTVACPRIAEEGDLIDIAGVLGLPGALGVTGVALDSRAIVTGNAFVALQGATAHGLTYLPQAKENGATLLLLDADDVLAVEQRDSGALTIPSILVDDLSSKLGALARCVYGEVDQKLALIGVTGTDGKTSITHFVAQLLSRSTVRGAVLGTVGNGFLGELKTASHTTGDVFQLYRQLADLQHAGARSVAMEVSSHALDQNRPAGLQFEVAVLSNLGSDHLDYHGDIASYAAAKALLFDQRAKQCVLNLDDAFGQQLLIQRPDAVGYSAKGASGARWVASNCEFLAEGIRCDIGIVGEQRKVLLGVLGEFNVSNILAACAVAESLGHSVGEILDGLPQLEPVIGRAELLRSVKGSKVVIDYAHTAQALSAILTTLREHFPARIVCVFGCGGDRDSGKRPAMARAAEAGADDLVVTSDNPRGEDPQQIIGDVLAGLSSRAHVHVEADRASAIAYALANAGSDDCVLIAGKGHEDYQVLRDRTVEFSDRAEVLAWRADTV